MSAHIEWLSARFVLVEATADPGEFTSDDGSANSVAAIKLVGSDGDGLIIEGRPEDLLSIGREVVRQAEIVVTQTMRDPRLRSLYGITSHPGTEATDAS